MSVFKDKVYEELDWISQAVEPMVSKVGETLALLPEERNVTFDDLCSSFNWNREVSCENLARRMIKQLGVNLENLEDGEVQFVIDSFTIKMEENTWIDFDTRQIHGEIKLIKEAKVVEDSDVKKIFVDYVSYNIANRIRASDASNMALRDLMQLFEIPIDSDDTKGQKINKIYRFLTGCMEDRIQIKTVDVWKSFIDSVKEYITTGDAKLLGHIMRILIMTKDGKPLYSL